MRKGISIALACVLGAVIAGGQAHAGDAENGQSVYKKRCRACHSVQPGANLVGPSLFGVVGRKAGTEPKYAYSKSYIEAGQAGLVWTVDALVDYLKDPKAYLKKVSGDKKARSKMYLKLRSDTERADVAAFLATRN